MTPDDSYSADPFAPAEEEDPATDASPAVSLRSLGSALRRRRRFWVTTAVLGLLLGASLHSILPTKVTAVSRLSLVEPSGADPTQAMQSEVSILETRAVAQRALGSLHLDVTPDKFLSSYSGVASSSSILTIKLSGPSIPVAVARANAVADAFLQVRADQLRLRNGLVIKGLQSQVATLQSQIQQLTQEISQLSPSAKAGTAQQIADLVNQRTADSSQLSTVQSQVQQAQLDETSSIQGSQVLDSATVSPASKKKVTIKDALSGLVAGLALGMTVVILGALISDRVRRRSAVAAALNAPVELSVGRIRQPRWFGTARLRRTLKSPTPQLHMIDRRLRGRLGSTTNGAVAIVEVAAAEAAALSTGILARSLVADGRRVLIVDAADGRPLARILGVSRRVVKQCRAGQQEAALRTISIEGREAELMIAPDDAANAAPLAGVQGHDVVLALATVDPALGADHISKWAGEAVVVVKAGGASAVRLDAVRHLLGRAGVAVDSVILVGADRDDQTVGFVPEPDSAGQAEPSIGALEAAES